MINKLLKRARIIFSIMVPLTCLAFLIGYFVIDSIPNFNAGLEKPTVYDYVNKLIYYISYNSFI